MAFQTIDRAQHQRRCFERFSDGVSSANRLLLFFFDNIFSYFPRKFFANAKISDFGPKNGILKMIQKIRILKMVQKKGSKIRILYIYKKWNSKNILKE